ncbi:hypothetical protein NSZ01_25440 [Nocardioides szechwanensis]|uniref:Uncharacterized protein n=1 Tax=Nocardioides szechwanensis TaxID=1005944 RepID=A0A1H0ARH1_9ACTN|nr:hypothetical protein [Nocardioides szechwanensis]GEP34776.1 hypothetical protein NSZ01_25440 [Nocardioides szechwanensis]SDN36067.1 hypothetical protein SAMN05192576_2117 [Nocardioides szechwanensis]
MENIAMMMTRFYLVLTAPRSRDERGDVPGWVLVTVMSAGIVMAIWSVASESLTGMLRDALNSVK